jgi:hypothetical protein
MRLAESVCLYRYCFVTEPVMFGSLLSNTIILVAIRLKLDEYNKEGSVANPQGSTHSIAAPLRLLDYRASQQSRV